MIRSIEILLKEIKLIQGSNSTEKNIFTEIHNMTSVQKMLVLKFFFIIYSLMYDSQENATKVDQIFREFSYGNDNNYTGQGFNRFLVFKLRYLKKIQENFLSNNLEDDLIEIYSDLIEITDDILRVLVRINAISMDDDETFSLEKANSLTDNNLIDKLNSPKNKIDWHFVTDSIDKRIRNSNDHVRIIYSSDKRMFIGSGNGKAYFEYRTMEFYRLCVYLFDIINSFSLFLRITFNLKDPDKQGIAISDLMMNLNDNEKLDLGEFNSKIGISKILSELIEKIKNECFITTWRLHCGYYRGSQNNRIPQLED